MKKIGILGGGQLGRMLLQQAANYPVETYVLENDPDCPAAKLCHHFTLGNIQHFDDVYQFGKQLDAITIEIESVNVEALEKLEQEGVAVFPSPAALKIIKNKISQKEFYKAHNISSGDFVITHSKSEVTSYKDFLPAVHKVGMGGYDGKGVQIIRSIEDIEKAFDAPSVLERMVDIKKELAVIVAVGVDGNIKTYPVVDMVFDPELNLLDYQISPANVSADIISRSEKIAVAVAKQLNSAGLFAVELFVDQNDEVWVNETAPRVHNSGHHSIEANFSSQFDMLWRIMLQYPLGNTDHIVPAAIVNLLGEPGYSGEAVYEGIHEVLSMGNTFVHIYGKKQTKPGRKMGHVTIVGNNSALLIEQAHTIKKLLKVVSQ